MISEDSFNQQNIPAELLSEFKENEPSEWIEKLKEAEIPNVFINIPQPILDKNKPLVIIVIGSSGSGKDTAVDALFGEGLANHAITATTRKRRVEENEDINKYTWIEDQRLPNETDEEFENRIALKYDLIEHNYHDNNVYGLPRKNFEEAISRGKPVVIRTENEGLKSLSEQLASDYNIVSIFVTAESFEVIYNRILKKNRNDILVRMQKAVEEIKDAKNRVNYVLLNPDQTGLETIDQAIAKTQNSMKLLFRKILSE